MILKKAFTLAEVLVTIGVLGVVAAITMPTLVGGTKPKELEAQFKQAHSMLSQAVISVVNEKGIGIRKMYTIRTGNSYTRSTEIANAIYDKLKVVGECEYSTPVRNYSKTTSDVFIDRGTAYPNRLLANGMCFNVQVNAGMINLSIDLNGAKKLPNVLGHDIFFFYIDDNDTLQPKKMSELLSEDEVKDSEKYDSPGLGNVSSQSGDPCSKQSSQRGNGIGCAYYALINQNPDDSSKTYWDNLP